MNIELRTFIDVGDGASLEAAITPPGPSSSRLAVVCHPWGKLGGCMDDGIVRTIARALAADGVGTCRFNFRGVGASSGSSGYTGGQGAGNIGPCWRRTFSLHVLCLSLMSVCSRYV